MTEHTPLKWTAVFEEFDGGGKTIPIVDALGMWICGVVLGMRDRKQAKANARLIAATPFAHEILDEIREALEQANGRETSYITRREMAPALARIRQYFKQVDGQ